MMVMVIMVMKMVLISLVEIYTVVRHFYNDAIACMDMTKITMVITTEKNRMTTMIE